MINGGISHNALPTETKTLINCRILPDETIEDTHKKIIELVQNPNITVKLLNGRGPSKPSSVDGPFMKALKIANTKTLNNLPIIPAQHSGATDSCFFRNLGMQAYGIGPIFRYESDGKRSHGVDERIPIAGLEDGYEFFYQLVTELANQK